MLGGGRSANNEGYKMAAKGHLEKGGGTCGAWKLAKGKGVCVWGGQGKRKGWSRDEARGNAKAGDVNCCWWWWWTDSLYLCSVTSPVTKRVFTGTHPIKRM